MRTRIAIVLELAALDLRPMYDRERWKREAALLVELRAVERAERQGRTPRGPR